MQYLCTLLLFSVLGTSALFAQRDDLFWFAVPEVTRSSANWDRPIVLRITSYNEATDVTVSLPVYTDVLDSTFTVPAGTLYTFNLTPWIDSLENRPADTILNRGLKITSTAPVSIYYEVVSEQCDCQPEIFALKGTSALGKEFLIPMQNYVANSQSPQPVTNSSFDIAATENGTTVTITPTRAIIGHAAGVPFTILLNAGQTYSAMAASGNADQHLNGSLVVSNKVIAITIKDDSMRSLSFGTCTDLGGDQIVPLPVLGRDYIAIKGFLAGVGDQLFVMAVTDSTRISFNGLPYDTLTAGETIRIPLALASSFIQGSAPISVLQISGFNCEMGIDILPQIICTGSDSVAVARSTIEPFWINMLVPNGGQNSFLVNGTAGVVPAAAFTAVPGTNGEWYAGQVSLSTGVLPLNGAALISNPLMPFHLSVLHGGSTTGSRFGYFSDFACPSPLSGMTHFEDLGLRIWPNPTNGDVYVVRTNHSEAGQVTVRNAIGQVVASSYLRGGESRITFDLSSQGPGLYVIELLGADGARVVERVVKQ